MKRTQVFDWVRETRIGREDLSDQPRPGWAPQIGLDTILAQKLELDPHTTVRKLALSLGVSLPTVLNHVRKKLGMKCDRPRWTRRLLDNSQKAEKVRCIDIMLEALDVHAQMNYRYLMTGDESRMMYGQTPSRMWALDRDHVEAIVRPGHQSGKRMVRAFFRVNAIDLVMILPEGMKLTSRYLKDEVLWKIYEESCGSWDLDCPTP
jgi:AcrR family transcriptional regulator